MIVHVWLSEHSITFLQLRRSWYALIVLCWSKVDRRPLRWRHHPCCFRTCIWSCGRKRFGPQFWWLCQSPDLWSKTCCSLPSSQILTVLWKKVMPRSREAWFVLAGSQWSCRLFGTRGPVRLLGLIRIRLKRGARWSRISSCSYKYYTYVLANIKTSIVWP